MIIFEMNIIMKTKNGNISKLLKVHKIEREYIEGWKLPIVRITTEHELDDTKEDSFWLRIDEIEEIKINFKKS